MKSYWSVLGGGLGGHQWRPTLFCHNSLLQNTKKENLKFRMRTHTYACLAFYIDVRKVLLLRILMKMYSNQALFSYQIFMYYTWIFMLKLIKTAKVLFQVHFKCNWFCIAVGWSKPQKEPTWKLSLFIDFKTQLCMKSLEYDPDKFLKKRVVCW